MLLLASPATPYPDYCKMLQDQSKIPTPSDLNSI